MGSCVKFVHSAQFGHIAWLFVDGTPYAAPNKTFRLTTDHQLGGDVTRIFAVSLMLALTIQWLVILDVKTAMDLLPDT